MGTGVVAAGHRLTAEAAADVLRAGGTAVDAAIAGLFMACACEPVLCSPGGGGFAMVRDGAGRVTLLDFFTHTPLARDPAAEAVREVVVDFGTATQAFHIGPATTATPGFFDGVEALHRAGGTEPLAALAEPAVRAARAGVVVSPFQHHLSTVVGPILRATPGVDELFAPAGQLIRPGERFRNPGLADALELLCRDGFAGSEVGRACIALQAGRGHLTDADVAAYEVVERQPTTVAVGPATVHLNPAPAASGPLVAHSLGQLASSDPVAVAAAFRATNAARRAAGPGGELAVRGRQAHRGTTHISVVDGEGRACAVTVSNGEGNGELVGDFGFMLNNTLGEDDVNPAGAAGWPPGTRLSSMMCPTIIEHPDGSLVALGSGGSKRIRSAITQTVVRLCLDRAELADAVSAPRLHVEGDGPDAHLDFEDHVGEAVRAELCAQFPDHRPWPRPDLFFGGVHAARRTASGECTGAGDARRDGVAIVVTP